MLVIFLMACLAAEEGVGLGFVSIVYFFFESETIVSAGGSSGMENFKVFFWSLRLTSFKELGCEDGLVN